MATRFSRRGLFRRFGQRLDATRRRRRIRVLRWLRPPGFSGEGIEACLHCDACVQACPRGALRKVVLDGHTVPAIDPLRAPCVLCDDLPCIPACPHGVLKPVAREAVRLGRAEVVSDRCAHGRGEACTACFDACPLPGLAISLLPGAPEGPVPRIHGDACTGCGSCLHACPEDPKAIRILPR
ncbi:MAG: 4Fe-4S dicluster domain-containing protein [Deltaproteobacteria bacterium]|nr:MAG: 4Fe-4S dicluster domain-containing protein [Deltaproteobacteria bacterium]